MARQQSSLPPIGRPFEKYWNKIGSKIWDWEKGLTDPIRKVPNFDQQRGSANSQSFSDFGAAIENARRAISSSGKSESRGGSYRQPYSGPSTGDLRRYSDLQISSAYRPKMSEIQRQIDNANAMGIQSQAAIGGWGREAGQEIANAGRRNYREVGGIQRNLGGMLSAIGAAAGPMGTKENNRAFFNRAAGSAGLIAGLGAADQGWFNRARDVNAQTTNFYRNNARDQYAQQAYELQQKRNDIAQAMAEAQAAGRIQAKQTAYDNRMANNQSANTGTLGGAVAQFYDAISKGTPVADAERIYGSYLDDPAQIAEFRKATGMYKGPAGSVGNRRLDRARKAVDRSTATTQ